MIVWFDDNCYLIVWFDNYHFIVWIDDNYYLVVWFNDNYYLFNLMIITLEPVTLNSHQPWR